MAVPHNSELAERLTKRVVDVVRVPCAIPARTPVAGLALFAVPSDLLRDSQVFAYTLRVIDTYGHQASADVILLNERQE
jgi:hypothetical protein